MASHQFPLDHMVNRPKPYTRANETDIRKTFARVAERRKNEPVDGISWNEYSESVLHLLHETNK